MSAEADKWLAFAREDLQMAELVLSNAIYNQGDGSRRASFASSMIAQG